MKFDPGKSFPYPVLRINSTDYEKVEFEVNINVEQVQGTTAIKLSAQFNLSDPDLHSLIKFKRAAFVLLVRCQSTYYRREIRSKSPRIEHNFSDGVLAGRTEISPFLIATKSYQNFRAINWHKDYADFTADLEEGSVLAIDEPHVCWIDSAEEDTIGSIFELRLVPGIPDGIWHCDPNSDRVQLRLSKADYHAFRKARSNVKHNDRATFVMNGVYLPALAWLLTEADHNGDDYSGLRWYVSLSSRLEVCDCKALGKGRDRIRDAQVLLERPFSDLLDALSADPN